jgi:hypothetical protein
MSVRDTVETGKLLQNIPWKNSFSQKEKEKLLCSKCLDSIATCRGFPYARPPPTEGDL